VQIAIDPGAVYGHQYRTDGANILDAVYRSVAEDYVAEFNRLVHEWRRATLALSFVAQKTAHPAFRRIVAMRELALPLIVSELRRHPDFLYLALEEIAGQAQVPADGSRDPRMIVEAWLRWAERQHAD
jgi:hypothetical protein